MDQNNLNLNYINLKEFFYKVFELEFSPITVMSVMLQLVFIVWITYQIYRRFQGTQAERVLRGLILLSPLVVLCYILKLQLITKLIEVLAPTIFIGLVVIFAPEFRRVLMQLGGSVFLVEYLRLPDTKLNIKEATNELIHALEIMQRNRVGALIIIEKTNAERYYINPGTVINATLGKEILLSIFNPKSPLHDGAVLVRGFTISAAAVILPMTENPKLGWQYGTRHRAAIGFSESTDALCIVVSEETGELSVAQEGRITSYPNAQLIRERVEQFFTDVLKPIKKNSKLKKYFQDIFPVDKG